MQICEIVVGFIIVIINACTLMFSTDITSKLVNILAVILWSIYIGMTAYKIFLQNQ